MYIYTNCKVIYIYIYIYTAPEHGTFDSCSVADVPLRFKEYAKVPIFSSFYNSSPSFYSFEVKGPFNHYN